MNKYTLLIQLQNHMQLTVSDYLEKKSKSGTTIVAETFCRKYYTKLETIHMNSTIKVIHQSTAKTKMIVCSTFATEYS